MIDQEHSLTQLDIGRSVRYRRTGESGRLTSWNETYIFVRFSGPGGEACHPNDCDFSHPDDQYTTAELNQFRRLVRMAESPNQINRIAARVQQPEFIERHGKSKCDAMYAVLLKEIEQ